MYEYIFLSRWISNVKQKLSLRGVQNKFLGILIGLYHSITALNKHAY